MSVVVEELPTGVTVPEKRLYFFLYVFFLLLLAYAVQDLRTSQNTTALVVARQGAHAALLAILAALGLYYAFTVWRQPGWAPVSTALWLITCWVVVVDLLQHADPWVATVHLGLSVLWILVHHFFRSYPHRYPEALPRMQGCIFIMFLFYVFSAFYAAHSIRGYLAELGKDRPAVVNMAYGAIVFLPWISIMKGSRLRSFALLLIVLVVLVSMKRGAIIVLPLMWGTKMAMETLVTGKRLLPVALKLPALLGGFLCCLGAVNYLSHGFLGKRFSAGELAAGSGRASAYGFVIGEVWQRTSVLDLLMGYGSGASERFLGTGVHNEWLEFVFSFGMCGAALYAFLFLCLGWQIRRLVRKASPYAPAYAMAAVYMLVVGMYGGIYFVHSTFYIMAFFGMVEGVMLNESKEREVASSCLT